jgi:hypothetical protein
LAPGGPFAVILQSDDVPLSTRVVPPAATSRRPARARELAEVDAAVQAILGLDLPHR